MLEFKGKDFYLDGEKYVIYSGAMHYFRILPEYWEDRLSKLKAMGLNTVETYVCWNLHEKKHNEFDFSGILDIKKYIKTAEKLGLNVILRPGPYICAEWDMGGLPSWLLKDKNVKLRCNDDLYLGFVKNYLFRLFDELKECFKSNGGNIIAVQVENEYGSFANSKLYLKKIKDLYLEWGIKELLFTSDGDVPFMLNGGSLDDTLETVNTGSNAGGRLKTLENFQPDKPLMCTEFWDGWFDHWGEKHHVRPPKSVVVEVQKFLELNASFNLYMFHGGTNFAFTAGANHFSKYQPTTTSYDYNAPLNEYGDYTPLYYQIREMLLAKQGIDTVLPDRPKTQNIGEVKLTKCTSLFDNLENIGEKHYSPTAEGMEQFDQSFGMILYKTAVKGKYGIGTFKLVDLHDEAYVFFDNKYKMKESIMDSTFKKLLNKKNYIVNFNKDENEITVLVDALGRTNYGDHITDSKGIHGIKFNQQNLLDYEVTTLPLDNLEKLDFTKNSNVYPLFFKGEFETKSNAECFVELKNFTKGVVYINGFNLGRFWNKGPQKTLYLPGCLLKTDAKNEIIVLEMENCKEPTISIVDKHNLG